MEKSNSNLSQTSANVKKNINPKVGFIFVFLIVLLFYLVPLLVSAVGAVSTRFSDFLYLYAVTFYTIIVLGIILFHGKDLDVFKDHFSLWAVVLGCFLTASRVGENNTVYKIFLALLGLRLSVHIILNRKSIKTPNLKTVFIGLLWSVITVLIIALLLFLLNPIRETLPSNLLNYVLNTILYQISFVTVIEEACFRGLIFGILMVNGYREDKALFIQAILFWGIHYLRIGSNPALFFIAVPVLTISLTLIIKEFKMLYLSIVVHTLANVLGPILVVILQHSKL